MPTASGAANANRLLHEAGLGEAAPVRDTLAAMLANDADRRDVSVQDQAAALEAVLVGLSRARPLLLCIEARLYESYS